MVLLKKGECTCFVPTDSFKCSRLTSSLSHGGNHNNRQLDHHQVTAEGNMEGHHSVHHRGKEVNQGNMGDRRPGPPPSYIPPEPQGASLYAVDPGGIRGCLYRYTYIRLNNGRRFWYYPTYVGRTSVAGWRWRPRQYRWVYYGIDLSQIRSYSCS